MRWTRILVLEQQHEEVVEKDGAIERMLLVGEVEAFLS